VYGIVVGFIVAKSEPKAVAESQALAWFGPPQRNFSNKFPQHCDNTTTTATMPSTHEKEKPWDTDDIDKWKVPWTQAPSCKHGF
jgi:hypothetical protein